VHSSTEYFTPLNYEMNICFLIKVCLHFETHFILQHNEVNISWILADKFCQIYISVCIFMVCHKYKLTEDTTKNHYANHLYEEQYGFDHVWKY
jgi:hypothetical protein